MSVPVSRGRRLAGLGLIVLGVVPLAALLTYWGALLPSGGATATSIEVARRARNLLLSLGVVGTYALIMLPTARCRPGRDALENIRPGWSVSRSRRSARERCLPPACSTQAWHSSLCSLVSTPHRSRG